MTAKLVTLSEVKAGLRIEGSDDDGLLDLLIQAASDRIVAHLKAQASTVLSNPDSPPETPPVVQQATILLVGYLYRGADTNPDGAFGQGTLPAPVTALLYPLRDPALA